MMEFLARIKAVLRRSKKQEQPKEYHCRGLTVDVKSRKVWDEDRSVDLTLKEFELLRYLLENRGTVLSREKILEKIWGYEIYGETRTVDVHIRTLRQKLIPDIRYRIKGDATILAMVANGLGVSLFPKLATLLTNQKILTKPLTTGCTRTLGVVIRSSKYASPAVKEFLFLTRKMAASDFLSKHHL